MKNPLLSVLFLLALSAGNLPAQSAGESQEDMIRKLLARVESLEAEVKQMKAQKSPRASFKETVKETATPVAETETTLPDESSAARKFPDLKLRGFADVDYHLADRGPDKNAFRTGQLDLFITSQLSENWNVLSENVIEAENNQNFRFEIERLLLQYTPRDYFNIAVGRYHTLIGYYSNAYYDAKWLQTAVGRPRIYAFEDGGGLLPIHNVGVTVNGAIPTGKLGLHYVAEIGNGRNYTPGEAPVQNISDNNSFKAVNLALFARPEWLQGFQTGVSVYFDRLNASPLPTVDQTIVAAHAVYVSPAFEWLNEAVLVRDSSSLGTFETRAFYTQVARQFGKFRPYLRYQYFDANDRDPIVRLAETPGAHQSLSLGTRYNLTDFSALKLQWDHALGADDGHARNELTLQFAFTF